MPDFQHSTISPATPALGGLEADRGIAEPSSMPAPAPYRPLTVEGRRDADGYVIKATGDLEMSTARKLESEIRAAEATDAPLITVDLSGLSFLDSTGLRLLVQAHARSEADSSRLRLIRGPRRVQKVFELTNTDRVLPFLD
jgi:anti-anti-sigma factor